MEIAILLDKTNNFGLRQDAAVITSALKHIAAGKVRIRESDPLEAPVPCDIAFHLEIPCYGWMPWCLTNYLLLNPEWYYMDAWEPYLKHFDGVIFRDKKSEQRFHEKYPSVKTWVMPWTCPESKFPTKKSAQSVSAADGFVWFLGGSKNKRAAAETLIPLWKESYPPLRVYATKELDLSGTPAPNVTINAGELDVDERLRLAAYYPGHVCASLAEGFGYTAAEAEANGAFMLLNDLEVYEQDYGKNNYVSWIKTPKKSVNLASVAEYDISQINLDEIMERFSKFSEDDFKKIRKEQNESAKQRRKDFQEVTFVEFWEQIVTFFESQKSKKLRNYPPVLSREDCPPITIVTLLYNRRKFFDLACHNIMLCDYPKDKIEWIIVEDSDDPNEDASDRVVQVGLKSAPLQLVYIPLEKKTPIGEKRNKGIERAKNDIILMMDDDDHYPETSFRRRVAWLLNHPWKPEAVACTTIACYDLIKGVSVVNFPPVMLPLRQRISEATLTFKKSWWNAQHFSSEADIAEGEDFLKGRESDVLEIPPQQIIVAFSHNKNTSSRRLPKEDAKPGCFWGFPKEFLIYIHGLAGVEVEEDKGEPQRRKR